MAWTQKEYDDGRITAISEEELIELVNDYETSHDEIPTEDTAIVYCEASGEPAKWANDLQFRQKAIKHNKHMHEHTKRGATNEQALQGRSQCD